MWLPPLTFERSHRNWKGSCEGWLIRPERPQHHEGAHGATCPAEEFYMCGQWWNRAAGLPTGRIVSPPVGAVDVYGRWKEIHIHNALVHAAGASRSQMESDDLVHFTNALSGCQPGFGAVVNRCASRAGRPVRWPVSVRLAFQRGFPCRTQRYRFRWCGFRQAAG